MTDTPQTLAQNIAAFAPGQQQTIGSQKFRNLALSVARLMEIGATPSYDTDAAAAAGGVQIGDLYRNGNLIAVRVV